MIIGYTVPEICRVTDVTDIFHFGQFFALVPHPPSLQPKKEKFQKNEKNA